MIMNYARAAAVAVALTLTTIAAWADPKDYEFQLVSQEVKKGNAVIAVKLIHKPSGRAIPDAVIFAKRIDMGPDNMASMAAPLEPVAGGRAAAQVPSGRDIKKALKPARATSPAMPSMDSRRGGGARTACGAAIIRGATVIMPNKHAANQKRQMSNGGAVGCTMLTAVAAPTPAMAQPAALATKKPRT
jgi:hypothetical protein